MCLTLFEAPSCIELFHSVVVYPLSSNISNETLQSRSELGRLLPHGAVLTALDLDTLAGPQVSVLEPLDHVVVEVRLVGANDHGGGDLGVGGELLLVGAVAKAEVLEEYEAGLGVGADGGVGHPLLKGTPRAAHGESRELLLGQVLAHVPPGARVVNGGVPDGDQQRADHHDALDGDGAGEGSHFHANVAAQGPAQHHDLADAELLEDLDAGLGVGGHGVGRGWVLGVLGQAMTWQINSEDAALRSDVLVQQNRSEDVGGGRVSVDA